MPAESTPYPHRQRAPGILLCECGALAGTGPASTWGADCPAAMREHIATLTTTLRDLRAQIDYIAHVGWDASCEAAAADALEADDATRLNRYAVRVAAESTRLRDLVRHQRGALHDVDLITDEEYVALAGDHAAVARLESYDALRARAEGMELERDAARAQLATARRTLSALDCRYTGGGVADVSGSHCPLGAPCERCAWERERDEARAELDALLVARTGMDSAEWEAEGVAHEALMVAENRRGGAVECPDCGRIRFVDGGPDIDLSPSRCQMCERGDKARTAALHEAAAEVRGLAREYLDRTIRSGNYMSALTDAASRIEALTTATNRSDDAR